MGKGVETPATALRGNHPLLATSAEPPEPDEDGTTYITRVQLSTHDGQS